VLRLLLERGVDVNKTYTHNLTALMWAAGYGRKAAVELLLAHGVDPRIRDDRGKTAADIARDQRHPEVSALLEQASAQSN
jgi:ankyrin repeat protein